MLVALAAIASLALIANVGLGGDDGVRAQAPFENRIALLVMARDGSFPTNQDSFVTSASAQKAGNGIRVTASVTSGLSVPALLDFEVYGPDGKRWFQFWSGTLAVKAGVPETLTGTWTPPLTAPVGTYTIKVGVFAPTWQGLLHWNNAASTFEFGGP